ncbi:dynein gamma flagellar outer [Cyclospora cayetanensis]|uniref:Dynein gamma flagellar outer n=1 Tax=Cyclospora cayetanensis TaxID=88456 RepID=A0A1D3CYS7_9EIME|nr:dynein gamma flagellar outer [Cyclospora cayetanensis]
MESYVERFKVGIHEYFWIGVPFTESRGIAGSAAANLLTCYEVLPSLGHFLWLRIQSIFNDFKAKRHDLLDCYNNRFDRDFIEFSVRVSDLESSLGPHINQIFETSLSIDDSLALLQKFQEIVTNESLKAELSGKINLIVHRYSIELTQDPMKKLQGHPSAIKTKEGKRAIKLYNRVAEALVEYELRWHQAWMDSVQTTAQAMNCSLLARDPSTGKLLVCFDPDIARLIREAKVFDRMDMEVPDSGRVVFLREKKLKRCHDELKFILQEYQRVAATIRPVTASLLQRHLETFENRLSPGITSITWASLNIESFLQSASNNLEILELLVVTLNDIVENRIESNIKSLSEIVLVDLPAPGEVISLSRFVEMQEHHVYKSAGLLNARSLEIENAVKDLLEAIEKQPIDDGIRALNPDEATKVTAQYEWSLYNALLVATRRSLDFLRRQIYVSPEGLGNLDCPVHCVFEVDLQLDGTGVRLHPSIEEFHEAINCSAVAILNCSKCVQQWETKDAQHAGNMAPALLSTSFGDRLTEERCIQKVLLGFLGSIQNIKDEVDKYLVKFDVFKWLWVEPCKENYKAFAQRNPSMEDFEKKLKTFQDVEAELQSMESTRPIGMLQINTSALYPQLIELARSWNIYYLRKLHSTAKEQLEGLTEQIRQKSKGLHRPVSDIDALRHVMDIVTSIAQQESDIEIQFEPVFTMYNMIDRYLPSSVTLIDKDEQDQRLLLRSSWAKLLAEAQQAQARLQMMQATYKRELILNINTLKADARQFREDFVKNGPALPGIRPRDAVERVKRFKSEYDVRARKQEIYHAGEELFGFPHQTYPELEQTKKELTNLTALYDIYVQVIDTIKDWKDILWTEAPPQIPLMSERIQYFSDACKRLPKQLKASDAFSELKKEIDDFTEVLPLLKELSKPSIVQRHWKQVEEVTGKVLGVENEMTRLQTLIEADLLQYKDDIFDICESADKQLVIEGKLTEIENLWRTCMLEFGKWKSRDYSCILQGGRVSEIQEQLEESQMSLNTMNAMRHVLPFKERVVNMLSTLSDVADTLESWTKVQVLWTSLEPVFTGGDIAKQMPGEAKRFHAIDKDWARIMARASETLVVVECCQNELLKQLLPTLFSGLESCQKSLESYLEGKRNKFPRFYFVSNPVLLKILSQGSDAEAVQDDFEKLFDAISRVDFDKADRKKITAIQAVSGSAQEVVPLAAPVKVEGNIEDWLRFLETQMQKSIKRECSYAAHESGSIYSQLTLREFCDKYIAQVSLLGIQMLWTADCQDALDKMSRERDRAVMAQTNKKFATMMADLVQCCLSDLETSLQRTKYETLVTVHVHQRDVFTDIWKKVKEHRIKDASDFEWLKQTRLYWNADTENTLISIADVECYLTCSQALGMFYGGAPAGPAGTGKTETVKDMGRTLGVFVVVTNCSDQHRFSDMAKIFKGLCQSGLWGCFDEFNRIDLEVLSVVAMQIESITLAKKQALKAFLFPGESAPIKLVPTTAYFITMNPGYAGRQELPENLKVLFRSVSMMVPDRQIIIKVKLASVGYMDIDNLSKKFKVLYGLCEEQLSKQRHYDFGLRNILSVLRTAGATKRSEPDADEEMLLMRTLRDMNLSKLVADDVPLFLSLLNDIFPRQASPPKKAYQEVESAVMQELQMRMLVRTDEFLIKIMQLYETSVVRHGFMLVGSSCSGKTTILNTLAAALTATGQPTRIVTMNPKAITAQQMYGVKDPISDEWTPGIFAWMWSRYNNRALKFSTWITCDGPVDAIWIENLNTVLDDNRILTLANSDRIPMTENTRIVFEVENLNNASPATVSRAGIIFISATDLGWKPLIDSWLQRLTSDCPERAYKSKIFSDLFENPVMQVTPVMVTVQLLNLLSCILLPYEESAEMLTPQEYENIMAYAVAWSCGALLEPEDRMKFNTFLQEKVSVPYQGEAGLTIFDYFVDQKTREFRQWAAPEWTPPKGPFSFSSILIPTLDSQRAEYIIDHVSKLPHSPNPPSFQSVLLLGGPGTAKTSTVLMFLQKLDSNETLWRRVNLSSATLPERFQQTIESSLERKTGKTYCPPGGKDMIFFLDDMSMPFVNEWGDQVTLELLRQLIEQKGFYFLEKDKRGDFKAVIGLKYIGAMNHPGGGRNDIPNRLKSKFFSLNMILPSLTSVDNIYGAMMRSRITLKNGATPLVVEVSSKLTQATIDVWLEVKKSLLPTPSRFHYIFNLRDLSRVFQGILNCPIDSVNTHELFLGLWKHECTRVLADKLCRKGDKAIVQQAINNACIKHFGVELQKRIPDTPWFADFLGEPSEDESVELLPAQKLYEPVPSLQLVRTRMPRGSAMLVGVGGSGKQSLTRLAAFIGGHTQFQIAITKTYNESALFDDFRNLYVNTGQKNQPTTFLLTDLEIRNECFLEYFNCFLSTGEISGLFPKDEMDVMVADRRADFVKECPHMEETMTNMYNFFLDRVRANLHIVLCFSPLSSKFSERAQKFPGLFSCTTIDWFLPWPEAALVAVSSSFLDTFEIDASPEKKTMLYNIMGRIHSNVSTVTAFGLTATLELVLMEGMDGSKLPYVNVGLKKLNQAAQDIKQMKTQLKAEEKQLQESEFQTNQLLAKVQSESAKAEKKSQGVAAFRDECLKNKEEIEREQEDANNDLQAALPYLREAEDAVKSITAKDIVELKTMKTPSDIIRLVFDGVLILLQNRLVEVKPESKKKEKDNINDETCELLLPYLELEHFNPAVAKKASNAAEGLCKWVGAMVMYHEAAKIVKPKMDYLTVQTARVHTALRQLSEAEDELRKAQAMLDEINRQFQEALASKQELEQRAQATKRRMEQANKLINGLAGEKARWTMVQICKNNEIPCSDSINIVEILSDEATRGEWTLQGLPADELSVENAIIVTRSGRYPLLVDPQGQALKWIKKKEENGMKGSRQCITTENDPRFKDKVEFCLSEGLPVLIENLGETVPEALDAILEKQFTKKGKRLYVLFMDQQVECSPSFALYMTTKLANPHFSPEINAKCTVIDFTVMHEGLEQQLLGRVLSMEQRSLEECLNQLLESVTANTKALKELDSHLLDRLSHSSGNLLDDIELIEVLANTKAKAKEVEKKLKDAQEKKTEINEKREQYRPVATRGSVLYFCMVEASSICWMYNSSLLQFLEQFDLSVQRSEKTQPTQKRVEKIIEYLTYQVYRYVCRGLFERHKQTFVMMIMLKILQIDGVLKSSDISLLLNGGAGLDEKVERPCPYKWLGQDSKIWLNILQLSRTSFGGDQTQLFCELPDSLGKSEAAWKKWMEDNEPENLPIPDYEDRIKCRKCLGHIIRLCLVRCIRPDRTMVASARVIDELLEPKYTEPVTDSIESIWNESSCRTPVMFLLSPGADPTSSIDEVAKKKRKFPTDKVSMGEGQELVAREKIKSGFLSGSWVVLQNCHLGLNFMHEIEELLIRVTDINREFRLWITCEPHNRFPIGLLQMSIKVTNESPVGLKAGLARSFTTVITQETLDKVNHEKWRTIVFAIAMLHSVVQERRKFGALGWCIPYEFNYSDLEASLSVVEKHLASTILIGQPVSWSAIAYMIGEVQYGGRITDDLDREMFSTYTRKWLTDDLFKPGFCFNNTPTSPHEFRYKVPQGTDISAFRDYVNTLPYVDQPSIFGLHVNADLTFRLQESSCMLETLQGTLPKSSSVEDGKSREESVREKCLELLDKIPSDYNERVYREQVSKLSGPPSLNAKGLAAPLNIFLFQEVQRMQRILSIVRCNLYMIISAIDGTVIMTPHLQVTRQHKKDQWALDDVVLHSEARSVDVEKLKDVPEEGVNVHGLYIEGSRWNWHESRLDESLPKVMIDRMPVVHATAITTREKRNKILEYGQFEPYDCPVYKYRIRTDKYLVFRVQLRSDVHPSHWKLRGTALLCSTE